MSSSIRILGHPGSGNTWKPFLLASLLGLPADLVQIDLGQASSRPDCENNSPLYLRLHPGGTAPVLIDASAKADAPSQTAFSDDATLEKYGPPGLLVRDSHACLIYLALKAAAADPSKASWYPVEAASAARVATWLSFAAGDVNGSLLHVRISKIFGWNIAGSIDDALTRSRRTLAFLEAALTENEEAGEVWIASAERPTIADVAIFPYVALAESSSKGELSLRPYPHVRDWIARFKKLPGYVNQEGTFDSDEEENEDDGEDDDDNFEGEDGNVDDETLMNMLRQIMAQQQGGGGGGHSHGGVACGGHGHGNDDGENGDEDDDGGRFIDQSQQMEFLQMMRQMMMGRGPPGGGHSHGGQPCGGHGHGDDDDDEDEDDEDEGGGGGDHSHGGVACGGRAFSFEALTGDFTTLIFTPPTIPPLRAHPYHPKDGHGSH